MRRAVILLSGGLDSGVMAAYIQHIIMPATTKLHAISIDYGQRHSKEIKCAKGIAKHLFLEEHKIVNLRNLKGVLESSLTGHGVILTGAYNKITQFSTVVPNRNMIMLSVAAGYAQSIYADKLFYAAHYNDTRIYPDCRKEFVKALDSALYLSTIDRPVNLLAPFIDWTKADNVSWGLDHDFPFELTWSCYFGRKLACGECGTCAMKGQRVLMADFTRKPIEQVKEGDRIISFNEDTFSFEVATIKGVTYKGKRTVYPMLSNSEKVYLTLYHVVAAGNIGKNTIRWRKLETLKRKDATYYSYIWNTKYLSNDIDQYSLGYLRGLLEGDGSIEDRGVRFFQKDREAVSEFVWLYDKYIAPTKMKIIQQNGIYKARGGYGKKFLQKTKFRKDRNFLLGYIAGWIISDGCINYNKSNYNTHTTISQKADSKYLHHIRQALKELEIKYCEYTGLNKGKDMFNEEGVEMTQITFSKCWRIPLMYGGSKRRRILQVLGEHYKVTNLEKSEITVEWDKPLRDVDVYDLETSSGSFICEGFVVHNCIERLKAFKMNDIKDPIRYKRRHP